MTILLTVMLISAAVLVHEAGHYFCARQTGINIEVFSVGFGPRLFGYNWAGTDFRVSLIPFGGYVMPAMDDEDEYYSYAPWRRAFMSLGGPFASIIAALAAVFIIMLIESGFHFAAAINDTAGVFANLCSTMVMSLAGLFSGHGQLSGIVGIVNSGSGYVGADGLNWLKFFALINLNLGIINLLPLPVLDGGKVAFCLLEKLVPGSIKFQYAVTVVAWVFLMGLMVVLTYKDFMGIMA